MGRLNKMGNVPVRANGIGYLFFMYCTWWFGSSIKTTGYLQ